jgi:sec-independent protein translocase protein TatC
LAETGTRVGFIRKIFSKTESADGQADMSFIDHIEALRAHLFRIVIAWVIAVVVVFIFSDWIFDNVILAPASTDFIANKWFCDLSHFLKIGDALCMPPIKIELQGNTVNGPFMAAINISMIGGLILAFPYIFYELWLFIKPALKAKELSYGRKSIFWVSLCFFLGAAFGYYVLAPFTFNFLANFKIGTTNIYKYIPTLEDFISTLTNLVLGCGIAFELPIIAFVLAKLGLISAKFLRKYRNYAYVGVLVLAAMLTPSSDWISQLIVAIPLFILYESSVLIVGRVDKQKQKEEASWE